MNKKFVTLLSVAVLSTVASGVYADELTLGGSVASNGDNSGLVVSEQPTETQPSASVEHSSTELGKESDRKEAGDHTGVVVEPTTPSEKPKEEQPKEEQPAVVPAIQTEGENLDLGNKIEKEPSQDNTGVVVEPTTPSEKPKEEKPKEETPKEDKKPTVEDTLEVKEAKQKAEDNVGVKETDEPKPLNIT